MPKTQLAATEYDQRHADGDQATEVHDKNALEHAEALIDHAGQRRLQTDGDAAKQTDHNDYEKVVHGLLLVKKTAAVLHGGKIEIRGQALPDIGKGLAAAQRARLHAVAIDQHRYVLASMSVPGQVGSQPWSALMISRSSSPNTAYKSGSRESKYSSAFA
ncbi:hypothetical protein MnTg04_01701 [bacterium MnTg04]|nr:hypothetical protein MnTg04_01701 [bacterium MnTg04]